MVMSWSHHAFFSGMTKAQTQKIEYAYFGRWEKCLYAFWNAYYFALFKMATCSGYDADSERSYFKYFLCYIIF